MTVVKHSANCDRPYSVSGSFFEDIFIGELHHIQSFQRGADTFKIASAVYQGVVQTGTAFFTFPVSVVFPPKLPR